jgi:hypothetical protein
LKINQEVVYYINYKPLLNFKKKFKANNNFIYCKNFFLFLLILDQTNKNNNSFFSISIKKKNKHFMSFLRAPNKYKKAQIKIELIRYEIKVKFFIYYFLNFLLYTNSNKNTLFLNNFLYFVSFYFQNFSFIESTLFFLKKKKILIEFDHFDFIKHILEL